MLRRGLGGLVFRLTRKLADIVCRLARRPWLAVSLALAAAALVALGFLLWPETYLHSAKRALSRHDYAAARTSLFRYLDARPRSAQAHLLLAQLERRSNQYIDAAKHLDACQRLGGPADAIQLERALGAIQNGTINPELEALCTAQLGREDADHYLILEALSQGYTKTYRLKEALACLERMLVLQPDSGYAYRRRAWIYSQNDQYDRAEADYRRALEIDPEDTVARLGLAQILLDIRKDGAEAAEHFGQLWQVQQDSSVAVGLARSWRRLDRVDGARRLLDGWLAKQPKDALALAERGQLALDEHALQEAETFLQRAVSLAPYHRDANYSLFLCLTHQGRTAEAEACQERMKQAEKVREQLAMLTRQLQETPGNADLRCQIAQLFLRYGAEEEGIRWLLATLETHPNHAPTHGALADYYDRKGEAARAALHRRQAGTDR
jgi:predicted Zn-dependent protease